MIEILTKPELQGRLCRLCDAITAKDPFWDTAIIVDRINQYYLTGTMQDGLIVIKRLPAIKTNIG